MAGTRRLVYSPKAYVYTKAQDGTIYDLKQYVVSGQIQRKVNQVSSAQVTLRNPYKLFTGGQGNPRAFHPMDPITIYLERLQGHPVRVFTGYLDTTPYLQLYPGTISLSASCTLKKLLYTYFDPALPYVVAFFEQYGWINTGQGSLFSIPPNQQGNAATQADVNAGKKPFTALQDGSLGKLLWAILTDIGQWKDTDIWIENLPDGIAKRVQALMKSVQSGQDQASQDFTTFLHQVIGTSSQGSASGTTGSNGAIGATTDMSKAAPAMIKAANQAGIDPQFVLATSYCECSFSASAINSFNKDECTGWFQFRFAPGTPTPNPGASWCWYAPSATVSDARDPGYSATAFCKACKQKGGPPSDKAGWNYFSYTDVQIAGGGGYSNWNDGLAEAQKLISQYGNSATANTTKTTNQPTTNQPTHAPNQSGATAPPSSPSGGGGGGGGSSNSSSGGTGDITSAYTSPFPGGSGGASVTSTSRTDEGVDWVLGPVGSNIVAIGNGDVLGTSMNGWPSPGGFMWYQLTDGPNKGAIIYYAEGIQPIVGKGAVKKGQAIAKVASQEHGVEFGYSDANGGALAASHYDVGTNGATDEGKRFARFMRVLGVDTLQDPGSGPYQPTGSKNIVDSTTGSASGTDNSSAQAFVTELNFPSMEDQVTAIALGAAHKGLMHDQALLPFVQQVAQASLRSFQSLPDGSFYAFYPDYFGEFGHHPPYWMIDDVEVLSGGVNLSDDALATHVFAVGDNTWPVNQELINMLFSSGAINIFNAFVGTGIIDTKSIRKDPKQSKGLDPGIITAEEAVQFIQRYGARPLVQDYPTVRNPIFEMLLAYQQFMFAWSNQFKTPFTFTFMPELFPGGKVGFKDHGLQMYINSVTHEWNYGEGGFTTTAEMTAPSVLPGVKPEDYDLPPLMVTAMVEPVPSFTPAAPLTPQEKSQSILNNAVSTETSNPPSTTQLVTNPLKPF